EAADRLVPPEEPEAGAMLAEVFAAEGIGVHTGAKVTAVEHGPNGFKLQLSAESRPPGRDSAVTTVEAERLLVATGRKIDLAALGVEVLGVDPSRRAIPVDDRLRAAPGVWAVGDVTGKGAFTHVSMYQARIALADILGHDPAPADYRALPRVTFTDPEVGSVGMSQHAAEEQGMTVRVGTARIPESARGWIHKAGNHGFIKVVADADRGVLVGATSAGPVGGEVLGLLTLAVHAEIPVEHLRRMIYAYPTFHRAVEDALRVLVL